MLATLPDAQPANAEPPLKSVIASAQPANKVARCQGMLTAAVAACVGEIEKTLVMNCPHGFQIKATLQASLKVS